MTKKKEKKITFLVADTRLYTLLCRSVRRQVTNFVEFRAVFALLLLSNRPRLDCRVSGLVLFHEKAKIESIENEGRGVAGKAGRGTRPGHVGQKGRGVITLHGPVRSECVCVCVFSARNSNQSGTIVSDHEVSIESYGKGKIPVNPA